MSLDPIHEFFAEIAKSSDVPQLVKWAKRGPLSVWPQPQPNLEKVTFDLLTLLQGDVSAQAQVQSTIHAMRGDPKAAAKLEMLYLLAVEERNKENVFNKDGGCPSWQAEANHLSDKAVGILQVPISGIPAWQSAAVRELVFCVQGIDGEFLKFDGDRFGLSPVDWPVHGKLLTLKISEIGTLCRKIQDILSTKKLQPKLHSCVEKELGNYLAVAVLLDSKHSEWTLLKLSAWTSQPLLKLRHLHHCASQGVGLSACSTLSLLYGLCRHGQYGTVYQTFFSNVWYAYATKIRAWLEEGRLEEGWFVYSKIPRARRAGHDEPVSMWREGFAIEEIPCFLNREVCERILLAGKSVRFVKTCCREVGPSSTESEPEYVHDPAALSQFAAVDSFSLVAMLKDNYGLFKQLNDIKKFILLSQGDFSLALIETLTPILSVNAKSVFKHSVLAALDQCLAAFSSDSLLDVILSPHSAGETGFDIFSLDFQVRSPLSVLLTDSCMRGYKRVGGLIWRLVRAEFMFKESWEDEKSLSNKSRKSLGTSISTLRHTIWHFVRHLRSYLSADVVDRCWRKFTEANYRDLDELIQAHEQYVQDLLVGSFLAESDDMLEIVNILVSCVARLVDVQRAMSLRGDKRAATISLGSDEESEAFVDNGQQRTHTDLSDSVDSAFEQTIAELEENFLQEMRKFVRLLEQPTEHEELHASLALKLDFNEYFAKHARV